MAAHPIVMYGSLLISPLHCMFVVWFLQFYAPWCEFSQAARPMFLEAVQHMLDRNITGVYIGKIDVSKHGGREECCDSGIRTAPV